MRTDSAESEYPGDVDNDSVTNTPTPGPSPAPPASSDIGVNGTSDDQVVNPIFLRNAFL